MDGWAHAHARTHTHAYRGISVTRTASAPKPDLLCGKSCFISHQGCNGDAPLSHSAWSLILQELKKKIIHFAALIFNITPARKTLLIWTARRKEHYHILALLKCLRLLKYEFIQVFVMKCNFLYCNQNLNHQIRFPAVIQKITIILFFLKLSYF